jgi:transcriptional regulator with XRE-family HTH domain
MEVSAIVHEHPWKMGIDPDATGKKLRAKRLDHQLTQEKLSDLFSDGGESASRTAIHNWESGKKPPSLSHVVFLAELYQCTIDELVISYRRSRDGDDRDQPVPEKILYVYRRRVYGRRYIRFFVLLTKGYLS